MDKEKEFERLFWDWMNSFGVSAFGSSDPGAQEPYKKLLEWCKNNKKESLQYIKEILEDEPNDIVMILQELYADELGIKIEGFMPLDAICNLWLNILNKYEGLSKGKIKDYYKDYHKWKKYLDKHYISWRPNLEDNPNVTQEEFKRGLKNKDKQKQWHDFPLSIMTNGEITELYSKGYITEPKQMFFIQELKGFYDKVKQEAIKRGIINE